MKTLYLLRHASPVAPRERLDDFDRPLTPTGQAQSETIGGLLATEQLGDAVVISSPAVRARETTELAISSSDLTLTPHYDSRIYDAELTTLLDVMRELDASISALLLVGHNPGMESLLRFFTGEIRPMPTAGLAKLVFERDSWSGLDTLSARLEWLITPPNS